MLELKVGDIVTLKTYFKSNTVYVHKILNIDTKNNTITFLNLKSDFVNYPTKNPFTSNNRAFRKDLMIVPKIFLVLNKVPLNT